MWFNALFLDCSHLSAWEKEFLHSGFPHHQMLFWHFISHSGHELGLFGVQEETNFLTFFFSQCFRPSLDSERRIVPLAYWRLKSQLPHDHFRRQHTDWITKMIECRFVALFFYFEPISVSIWFCTVASWLVLQWLEQMFGTQVFSSSPHCPDWHMTFL